MDFLTRQKPRWPWSESLDGLFPDPERIVRVAEIEGEIAGDRCGDLGIFPGALIRLLVSTPEHVVIDLVGRPDGIRRLEVAYALYIRVEPVLLEAKALPRLPERRPARRRTQARSASEETSVATASSN